MATKKIQLKTANGTDILYPKTTIEQVDNLQTTLNGKENADNTILKQANVVDNVSSTSTIYPLSANKGKELNDRINNLSSIGRFLAIWDCTTGLPTSQPSSTPYTYNTGDYYRVGNVGATNYQPTGATYTGVASTTIYSGEVQTGDIWFYDGTTWNLQINHLGAFVQDVKVNNVSVVSGGTANVSVPTKTSDLTNDSDFITSSAISGKEDKSNKITSLSSGSTDTQYPSAKCVFDNLQTKANTSGDYANINAGGLVSTTPFNNTTNYVFRDTANGGDINGSVAKRVKKVEGNLIKWNQLVQVSSVNNQHPDVSTTISSNTITINIVNNNSSFYVNLDCGSPDAILGHKYYLSFNLAPNSSTITSKNIYFGNYIQSPTRIDFNNLTNNYAITTGSANGTANVLGIYLSGTFTAGTSLVFKDFMLIDLTACGLDSITTLEQFNATDLGKLIANKGYLEYSTGAIAELNMTNMYSIGFNQFNGVWEDNKCLNTSTGGLNTLSGFSVTDYIRVLGGQTYYIHSPVSTQSFAGVNQCFYDANKNYLGYVQQAVTGNFINTTRTYDSNVAYVRFEVATSSKENICVNLSHSGTRNGEYKPYEKHTYSNAFNGYAIGNLRDTKLPNGTITRKIGKVDLGSLSWNKFLWWGSNNTFNAIIPNVDNFAQAITYKYTIYGSGQNSDDVLNGVINAGTIRDVGGGGISICISDTDYTDATAFKNSLSGVYLYYELATPTTEQGTSYDEYQLVDDYGTEGVEYANGYLPVPLNHETQYKTNYYDYIKRSYNYTSGNPNKVLLKDDLRAGVASTKTTLFRQDNYTYTTYQTWEDTGMTIVIPAGKKYCLTVWNAWHTGQPLGVRVVNTDGDSIMAESTLVANTLTVFMCGIGAGQTWEIYAKGSLQSGIAFLGYQGWYED